VNTDVIPLTSRAIPITSHRALVLDVLHFARRVPYFPVERVFDLSRVAMLREAAQPRISWSVLFLKAFARVAARHSGLRRSFARWPWPHLLESNSVVALIAMNREHEGHDRLCWGSFRHPERRKLAELNERLHWYQTRPVEEAFVRQLALSRLPTFVRRFLVWWNLNFAGRRRVLRLGTFSISSLAAQQSLNRDHPSILTSSLSYGPIDERGRMVVTLLCDHRVLDGVPAAAALAALEGALRGEICDELASLAKLKAA
jgi:hypothetical protein